MGILPVFGWRPSGRCCRGEHGVQFGGWNGVLVSRLGFPSWFPVLVSRFGFPSWFPLVSRIGQLPVESEGFMTDNAREWMQAWRSAGVALEKVRREELRALDGRKALALLTGPANYRKEPRKPRQSSGLVEQQRWFMKARGNA